MIDMTKIFTKFGNFKSKIKIFDLKVVKFSEEIGKIGQEKENLAP